MSLPRGSVLEVGTRVRYRPEDASGVDCYGTVVKVNGSSTVSVQWDDGHYAAYIHQGRLQALNVVEMLGDLA